MSARVPRPPNGQSTGSGGDRDDHLVLRLNAHEYNALRRLAAADGLTLSDWLRRALVREAHRLGIPS